MRDCAVTCKICGEQSSAIFRRIVLSKYDIQYYQCSSCGFIQTEEPYWLDEAYENSLNIEDTGIVSRNLLQAKRSAIILLSFFKRNGCFVDFGGGTGLFVRLMRDYGFDFYWHDPYTKNLFARGFEFDHRKQPRVEALTSFECFEHFPFPAKELETMLSYSRSLLFSTSIFSSGMPDPQSWEYYAFGHGQHISLYSLASLQYIAKKNQLHLCTNGKSFHMLTPKPFNNAAFNILLKASQAAAPAAAGIFMNSKTEMDSKTAGR